MFLKPPLCLYFWYRGYYDGINTTFISGKVSLNSRQWFNVGSILNWVLYLRDSDRTFSEIQVSIDLSTRFRSNYLNLFHFLLRDVIGNSRGGQKFDVRLFCLSEDSNRSPTSASGQPTNTDTRGRGQDKDWETEISRVRGSRDSGFLCPTHPRPSVNRRGCRSLVLGIPFRDHGPEEVRDDTQKK